MALFRRELWNFPTISILLLSSTFASSLALDPPKAMATFNIRRMFADALNIYCSPRKLKSWTQLPHIVVLMILQYDFFHTDSEATVVLLADAWVAENPDCPEASLAQLKGAIRYAYLDQSYLCTALQYLPNLSITKDEHIELRDMYMSRSPDGDWVGQPKLCPAGWFVRRKFNQPHTHNTAFELHLGITHEQLQAHVTAVTRMTTGGPAAMQILSDSVIAHGYQWMLVLKSDTMDTAFAIEMRVCLPAREDTIVQVRCRIALSVHRKSGTIRLKDSQQYKFTQSTVLTSFECGTEALGGDPDLRHWSHWLDKPLPVKADQRNLCIEAYVEVAAHDYGAYF